MHCEYSKVSLCLTTAHDQWCCLLCHSYNLEENSRVVLCRFESMAILVHGNIAVITETRVCVCVFSDFSVGFCINEEKGYLLPTLARKITLLTFRLNAPVIIRAKVETSAKLFSELELVTE